MPLMKNSSVDESVVDFREQSIEFRELHCPDATRLDEDVAFRIKCPEPKTVIVLVLSLVLVP